jgi:acyl carrier protein
MLRTRLAEVLEVEPATLTDDFPLTGGNWDSMSVLTTLALVDELYGVPVPAKALVGCTSVGSLLDGIRRAVSAKVSAD